MRNLFLFSLGMLCLACSNPFDNSRSVRYTITGDCGVADIDYINSTGGTSSLDDVELPWSQTVSMEVGDWAYVSGWGWEGGTITASVYVDEEKKESETGTGESSCHASAGLYLE